MHSSRRVSCSCGGDPVVVAALAAGAIATSTILKRAWTVDGEDRHHLIDPHTGRSMRSRVVAVTAFSRNAAHAEIATKAALLSPPGWDKSGREARNSARAPVGAEYNDRRPDCNAAGPKYAPRQALNECLARSFVPG